MHNVLHHVKLLDFDTLLFVQKHYLQFSGWIETLHCLSELFHLLLLLLVNFDFSSTGWSAVKVFGAT